MTRHELKPPIRRPLVDAPGHGAQPLASGPAAGARRRAWRRGRDRLQGRPGRSDHACHARRRSARGRPGSGPSALGTDGRARRRARRRAQGRDPRDRDRRLRLDRDLPGLRAARRPVRGAVPRDLGAARRQRDVGPPGRHSHPRRPVRGRHRRGAVTCTDGAVPCARGRADRGRRSRAAAQCERRGASRRAVRLDRPAHDSAARDGWQPRRSAGAGGLDGLPAGRRARRAALTRRRALRPGRRRGLRHGDRGARPRHDPNRRASGRQARLPPPDPGVRVGRAGLEGRAPALRHDRAADPAGRLQRRHGHDARSAQRAARDDRLAGRRARPLA